MSESETKDWVEDLLARAESKRFWKQEKEWIDLEMCCLILPCSLWEKRPTYRMMSKWHANYYTSLLFFEAGRTPLFVVERSLFVE